MPTRVEELEKLAALLEKGLLSHEEFERAKASLLADLIRPRTVAAEAHTTTPTDAGEDASGQPQPKSRVAKGDGKQDATDGNLRGRSPRPRPKRSAGEEDSHASTGPRHDQSQVQPNAEAMELQNSRGAQSHPKHQSVMENWNNPTSLERELKDATGLGRALVVMGVLAVVFGTFVIKMYEAFSEHHQSEPTTTGNATATYRKPTDQQIKEHLARKNKRCEILDDLTMSTRYHRKCPKSGGLVSHTWNLEWDKLSRKEQRIIELWLPSNYAYTTSDLIPFSLGDAVTCDWKSEKTSYSGTVVGIDTPYLYVQPDDKSVKSRETTVHRCQ